jgi:hypothetical protein
MKLSKMALAAAVAWSLYAGHAQAQQPGANQQVAFDYYYYQPEAPKSPSDVAAAKAPPAQAPYQAPYQAPAQGHVCTDACAAEEAECEPWRLFCQKECGWNIYGFLDAGIMANMHNPQDSFNGPVTFPDRDWGQFNQFYWITEKTIDTGGCGWDWGGRVDVLFGSDYVYTMATGLELRDDGTPHWNQRADGTNPEYGLAIPQIYAELGYNDLSLKLGHFYTVLGYEVVPATGNFFYTHAYTMQYGEPFTHTGALATWKYSETSSLIGGIVNGWDHFDREVDTGAALLGYTWNGGDALSFALSGIFSPNEPILLGPAAGTLTNRNAVSFVATYAFNDCWTYVYQSDLGWQHDANAFTPGDAAEWYGINQYLFYTLNDCWKFGTRFEWFRDDDGARVTGLRNPDNTIFGDSFAGNFFNIAVGANWTPTANWIVRPELRYDWFDGITQDNDGDGDPVVGPYDDSTRVDQWVAGFDVIFLW